MEPIKTELTEMLGIKYPIIIAPMFLVSNTTMVIEAVKAGITGAIPALNYRTNEEFSAALKEIRSQVSGPIGINLIVNKIGHALHDLDPIFNKFSRDREVISSKGNG